ncbi:MAG: GTPase ObgE [Deltaproteobacteria bacterium]|nr:GTPase ObgE [Deltaproteobacteria bacterium]
MKFVDSCEVDVVAGKGGNGAIAFRREKFVPFGGPSGGDGGRGGDVVFVADEGLSTLLDLTYGRALKADHGEHGQGKDCYGKAGKDLVVRVPVGTQVFDRETRELLFDIDTKGVRVVVAAGGKGGRGNIHFATPYDRAPRRSEPGELGEERRLRLELKVMADVGLLGFPNVGKSTFIRACSRAQPKVADYPFTTLTPHLGVVRVGDEATFVLADIPGLIPGAAEGAGLGHRFLKHVERCRALLHLVTFDPSEGREPLADYDALRLELEKFDPALAERPEIVALSKADIPEVREAYEDLKKTFAKKRKVDLHLVSAATGEGVRDLTIALWRTVTGKNRVDDWDAPAAPARESTPAARKSATTLVERPIPEATAKKASANEKKAAAKKVPAKKASAKKASAPKKKAPAKPPKKKATSKKPAKKKKAPAPKRKAPAKKPPKKKATSKKR